MAGLKGARDEVLGAPAEEPEKAGQPPAEVGKGSAQAQEKGQGAGGGGKKKKKGKK